MGRDDHPAGGRARGLTCSPSSPRCPQAPRPEGRSGLTLSPECHPQPLVLRLPVRSPGGQVSHLLPSVHLRAQGELCPGVLRPAPMRQLRIVRPVGAQTSDLGCGGRVKAQWC